MKNKRILIVCAHPDDEVLGCGGTIAKLVKRGCEAFTLILGEGITSRYLNKNTDNKEIKKELNLLKKQAIRANEILGVKEVFFKNFPDNKFDSIDLLEIIKAIEEVKREVKPEIIFTHSRHDLNKDHRLTYEAMLTASRPLVEETVRSIYSFEVLSSTEWNYPQGFSPNLYFDIEETLEIKLEAMKAYSLELRRFPHPRSVEGIKIKASQRGMEIGLRYAEAFEVIRDVRR